LFILALTKGFILTDQTFFANQKLLTAAITHFPYRPLVYHVATVIALFQGIVCYHQFSVEQPHEPHIGLLASWDICCGGYFTNNFECRRLINFPISIDLTITDIVCNCAAIQLFKLLVADIYGNFGDYSLTTSAHDVAAAYCLAMAEVRVRLPLGALKLRVWGSLASRVPREYEIAGSNPAILTE
jgi:hypothetical protein